VEEKTIHTQHNVRACCHYRFGGGSSCTHVTGSSGGGWNKTMQRQRERCANRSITHNESTRFLSIPQTSHISGRCIYCWGPNLYYMLNYFVIAYQMLFNFFFLEKLIFYCERYKSSQVTRTYRLVLTKGNEFNKLTNF